MPLYTVSKLTINGVVMPTPKVGGMKVQPEKIWSQNTKRTAGATMVGTIVDIKSSVEISWPPLTVEEVRLIESVVSNKQLPFAPMTFTDQTGTERTMIVYFGTPTYTLFDWIDGQWKATDVKVTGIQQ